MKASKTGLPKELVLTFLV